MLHALDKYNRRVQDSENLIPEDEPVFLLRAQDMIAADVVRYWCELQTRVGGNPQMVRIAKDHAAKMDLWDKKKVADSQTSQTRSQRR